MWPDHPLTPTHTPPQSKARPLTMLMLSSSMELIDPYRYKDTATTSNEEKKKKDQK
jgi:hypothetical protein